MYDMDFESFCGEPPRSQRADQKEATRTRILAAALALIRTGGEEVVTVRAVAAMVGVTERTVYRHFKSRRVLIDSVWQVMNELIVPARLPTTPAEMVERPRSYFPRLEQDRDIVRAYLHSQSRASGPREQRDDKARSDALIECVQTNMEYLDKGKLRRRAAIADLIASPYALEWMQQFWGFGGTEAGEAAAEALDILINLGLAY